MLSAKCSSCSPCWELLSEKYSLVPFYPSVRSVSLSHPPEVLQFTINSPYTLADDLGQDGWARHESYEDVVGKNPQLKKEWLAAAEDEDDFISVDRFWPFRDHEELD